MGRRRQVWFTSPDPLSAGADLGDGQTWNGYAYVGNSPLSAVDPDGMDQITYTSPGEGSGGVSKTQIYVSASGGGGSSGTDYAAFYRNFGVHHASPSAGQIAAVDLSTCAACDSMAGSPFEGHGRDLLIGLSFVPGFGRGIAGMTALGDLATGHYGDAALGMASVTPWGRLGGVGGVFFRGRGEIAAEIRVSRRGLDMVTKHLSQFGNVGRNTASLDRLERALASGEAISSGDANFYLHELAEANFMKMV